MPFRGWPRASSGDRGSYSNVVGLPVARSYELLRQLAADARRLASDGSRAILSMSCYPEVLMTHRYIKIGVTIVVLVLAFCGLMWATLREGTDTTSMSTK